MTSASFLTRHPLIGAAAGLLLLSACSSAAGSPAMPPTPTVDIGIDRRAESTPASPASTTDDATGAPATSATPPAPDEPTTSEPVASTNPPPATASPQPSATPAETGPIDAVDVAERTVFGVSVFDVVDVDAVTRDVSTRLGAPTVDSGWQSMEGLVDCAGSTDFRVLWWGDFRMTFERYQGDGVVRDELSAWTVGDPSLFPFAPIAGVPAMTSSEIVTLEGIGLGSTRADVEATWTNVHHGGDDTLVVIDRGGVLTLRLEPGDRVVGFGDGPLDCPVDEMR